MAGNTFGSTFRVTTWGESHGPAIGVVIDGCPPGLDLDETVIQKELDRRRPGQSGITTPRSETDTVMILSGVFEGKTTGTPIALEIKNRDAKSSQYDNLKSVFRPGHADYTFYKKFGIRDHRGGGRSSGRETAARVAAGAVAKMIAGTLGISITAYAKQVGTIIAETIDFSVIETNPVRCPDPEAAVRMERLILEAKEDGDSVGGIVEIVVKNCPSGLGDPVFDRLDADLAKALMSIGTVKGVEIGAGFDAVTKRGSENNDEISSGGFLTNNAGGILGGISTGQDIVIRIAVKPTSSILKDQRTVDIDNNDTTIRIEGRHDPCIVPRVVPVAESMVALVLADKALTSGLV